jgi:RNA polymerase sigma factor (sigma-70 family)
MSGVRSVAAWPATEPFDPRESTRAPASVAVAEAGDGDVELIERARSGDQHAFGLLVSRYQEIAFRTAYLITRDSDDAADAAQQAFIKAYGGLRRFRAGAPFRPWLLRIVANEAFNLGRSAGARGRLARRVVTVEDSEPSPEDVAIADERRAQLLDALARARPEDRIVIAYRYFLDMTEAEMAAALDCPTGTVKSRLSRALVRLRSQLEAPQ